jgi:hypothetical protein
VRCPQRSGPPGHDDSIRSKNSWLQLPGTSSIRPSNFPALSRHEVGTGPEDGVHVHWLLALCAVFKERVGAPSEVRSRAGCVGNTVGVGFRTRSLEPRGSSVPADSPSWSLGVMTHAGNPAGNLTVGPVRGRAGPCRVQHVSEGPRTLQPATRGTSPAVSPARSGLVASVADR